MLDAVDDAAALAVQLCTLPRPALRGALDCRAPGTARARAVPLPAERRELRALRGVGRSSRSSPRRELRI